MKLIIKVLKFSKFKNTEIDIHSYKFNYFFYAINYYYNYNL